MNALKVWARWRPLKSNESQQGEIIRSSDRDHHRQQLQISITASAQDQARSSRERSWKSAFSFDGAIEPHEHNSVVYNRTVAPIIPDVLRGRCCNFFAYGHSGSGKTHTMIGYDFENSDEFGLCLAAARQLATALDGINAEDNAYRFGIGLRVYELRKNSAFDLLNNRTECFVREGPDRRVYIRGETEMLEDGRVRVRPIATRACWNFEQLQRELQQGLKHRKTATSTVHDQSSRTHAIIEMEIITTDLLDARASVVDRQSELVPVGKYATDVYIEEQLRAVVQTEDGKYSPNPDYQVNQQRVDAAETQKAEFEARVKAAEQHESEVFTTTARAHECIGGRLVFVDLAGAEFISGADGAALKQSPQEKQQGRQINTDLLALKEVIRARSLAQPRIPYRSSPLTMVLRHHFEASSDAQSSMILTVSPATDQYAATMNTLKYGDLVGLANINKR
ncbi:P-loop containing nucleoside triphosphate hydrolase protein [Aspergillus steynii IBT 23096]|uniref:Kinesin-like protein n=1 Tax=Aspergillus steynii IBT 23096 TaxID=1392250 RepID=A0A2I2GPT6_9EURO|nr:P-loop containing nucleoside triphosphate hydrolase protein [Aspergillus steynii IBT 23096]PLB54890.1 P-loop containing nucleoside triphosphate hydrolase protein [Aspergillus steynii IBT 23096]